MAREWAGTPGGWRLAGYFRTRYGAVTMYGFTFSGPVSRRAGGSVREPGLPHAVLPAANSGVCARTPNNDNEEEGFAEITGTDVQEQTDEVFAPDEALAAPAFFVAETSFDREDADWFPGED